MLAEQVRDMLLAAKRKRAVAAGTGWASPGELARAVDRSWVQTPALDAIDAALVDVAEGRTDRLIVSMPPQEGKSTLVTRFGTLWMLQRNPNLRCAVVSYSEQIAGNFSQLIKNDITAFSGGEAPFDLGLRLRKDARARRSWSFTGKNPDGSAIKGGLIAVGIGSALTGQPADVILIDDPVKDYRAADSDTQSDAAWEWWQSVARPRLAPGAPVILILTRWSEKDLAGRLLAQQAADEASGLAEFDRWRVVNIPAEADHDPNKGESDALGREPGEFIISARGRSETDWARTKAATSPRIWSALYQGKPSPTTGAVWLRPWWQRYTEALWVPQGLQCRTLGLEDVFTSWDMTFKDTKGSDYVVGQVWGRRGAEMFLLDQVRDRMSFTKTVEAFVALAAKWPDARKHLVEDKANGPAVISTLSAKIPGIVPVTPHDSKLARANAVAVYIQSGNVKLPADGATSWDPDSLITEAAAFPNGAHDDQVDATSQALAHAYIDSTGAAAWLAWLQARVEGRGLPAAHRELPAPDEPVELVATTDAERRMQARTLALRQITR